MLKVTLVLANTTN